MPDHEQLPRRPFLPGHKYQHVQVNEGAKAHLGDTYHISQFLADAKEERHETDTLIGRENPLSLLPFATNAPFNSYDRQHEPTCLPNTRVDVLQKISRWADSEDQQCLFWLSGMAGTGKSTIAHTVARAYFEQGRLATLEAGWPGEQALRRLVLNASGLFIWAATVCRFIREGRGYAAKRLSMMLDGITSASTVLKTSVRDEYLEEEKQDMYSFLRQVLGTIVALYSPLSVSSLSGLLHLPKGAIERGLADLHAILDIPKDTHRPLHLHHERNQRVGRAGRLDVSDPHHRLDPAPGLQTAPCGHIVLDDPTRARCRSSTGFGRHRGHPGPGREQ